MSPQALAALVHQRLLNHVDPDFRTGQQRFFQHEVDSYGVRTVNLNAVIREVYREVKPWPVPQRDAFMKLMWETGKLEPGALVCHVYRRFGRSCGEAEFRLFERWLDRYVHNWAHTDGVSSWLLSACIANQPDLRLELMPWTESRNRWKRRASAVALLQEAKHGRHTEFIFNIASRLLPDRDDMVEKGVGWLLKETYPARPGETLAFLLDSRNAASRLTLRYAAEKMTPAHRRELLSS
ncbi:MAG: DNA alkylation repair protein [Acidobacteria bacterium]|nr:DNA alkylation repair protein [Acidobacteriota bacterium]